MFTVREFGCDVMIIVTVFPMEDEGQEATLKADVSKRFLRLSNLKDYRFRVTSVFWQRLANASDEAVYEHIGGTVNIKSFLNFFN